jgi:hypothetical protein
MNNSAPSDPSAHRPGPQRQASPPSDKELASTRSLLRVFVLLLLGALVSSNFPLPWKVLGLLFSLAALTVGILALVSIIRHKAPVMLRMATTVGLVAAFMFTFGTGAAVLLWPITAQYEECMASALTSKAQRQCEDDLRNLGGLLEPQSSVSHQENQWSTS